MTYPDYLLIPYQVIADPDIEPTAEKLYGVIYWMTKLRLEKCFASNDTLAEYVKTTARTIQNSLDALEKKGYITRIYRDTSKRNREEIVANIHFGVRNGGDTSSEMAVTRVRNGGDQSSNISNKIEEVSADADVPSSLKDYRIGLGWSYDSDTRPNAEDVYPDIWWLDRGGGVRARKSDLHASEVNFKRLAGIQEPSRTVPESAQKVDKLVDLISTELKAQYGSTPIFGKKEKAMLSALMKRRTPAFIGRYGKWFFRSTSIDKKYKYSVEAFTSNRFINQYIGDSNDNAHE
jgi:hypothetical protein